MQRLCSKDRCTRTATRTLVFDAGQHTRAEAHTCDPHRDELAALVDPYAETHADLID